MNVKDEMMKAALVFGPNEIRVLDVPRWDPGLNQILVRVKMCMTSGTTIKKYVRPYPGLKYPYGLGYEWAGVIEEVGEGVDESLIGTRCTETWDRAPDDCYFCLRGQPNLCANLPIKGHGPDWSDKPDKGIVTGRFKEFVILSTDKIQPLPDHVSDENASQMHYLIYAHHGNSNLDIQEGDSVAVLGSGASGLLHMMLSHLRGAKTIAIDPIQSRLDFAKKIGAAEYTINARNTDDAKKGLEKLNLPSGCGPDVVIECVGTPDAYEEAINLVRKGGQVSLYGGCEPGTNVAMSTFKLHYEEIKIVSSFHAHLKDFQIAYDLIESGTIDLTSFVSGKYPLTKVQEAMELHMKGEGIKYAIVP